MIFKQGEIMRVAFDYGGTLSPSANGIDVNEAMREIAWGLQSRHELFVLSATDTPEQDLMVRNHIGEMYIKWADVQFVRHGRTAYDTGLRKGRIMLEKEIHILFDDTPDVCRAVRDLGLIAFQVK